MAKKAAPIVLRTRITGMQFLKGKDLQDHSGNFRTHPQHQRDALSGVLREVGIAGALLVYQSARQGGLTVIDGHLRKGDYPDQEWPCLMTDLDDADADYMLLLHDELGRQAEREKVAVQALMERVQSGEAGVQALISKMGDELGILVPGLYPSGYRGTRAARRIGRQVCGVPQLWEPLYAWIGVVIRPRNMPVNTGIILHCVQWGSKCGWESGKSNASWGVSFLCMAQIIICLPPTAPDRARVPNSSELLSRPVTTPLFLV